MTFALTPGTARATSTDVPRGIDVAFTLQRAEYEPRIVGSCTLLPAEDGRPVYETWGDVDMWLDGRTVDFLRDHEDRREILDAISSECGAVAARAAAL